MSLATPTKSYSEEEVISYFEMMNDPNTLIEGITNLTLLCSEAKVIFSKEQSSIIFSIIDNNIENREIIDRMLNLLYNILQFEHKYNVELFSTEPFLHFFLVLSDTRFSLDSLFHIVSSNFLSASTILKLLQEGSIVDVESLLSPNSYNLEYKIHFLSSFSKYDDQEFIEFISQILMNIFKLSQLGIRPTVRLSCLSFLKDALCVNNSLVELIAYHKFFSIPFQSPPKNREERILELNLLSIVSGLTRDAMKVIVDNNLLPFVLCSLRMPVKQINSDIEEESDNFEGQIEVNPDEENSYFDVACAALDVLREIAFCGAEATEILYKNNVVGEIWQFLDDQNQFNVIIAALMALLEIIKYSPADEQNWMAENGLFEILGSFFESIPQNYFEMAVNDVREIILISEDAGNESLLNTLFGTQSLMEQIEELSINDDEETLNQIALEILEKAKLNK